MNYMTEETKQTFPELTGRPKRDSSINEDDINNLKIALYARCPDCHDPLVYFLSIT